MEIRTLRYFLAVAQEENMTRAAERIHVTQPTLSKALKSLEQELGQKLFTRSRFSIRLTEEGRLLRQRAEDLVDMADRIAGEFSAMDGEAGGHLYLGLAESHQIRHLARAVRRFKRDCPALRYHITSGDTEQVTEKLDRGILDFAVMCELPDSDKYEFLAFPEPDTWVVVMPEGCDLARKAEVTPQDLLGRPLFCSEQSWRNDLPQWCGTLMPQMNLEGSFRLAYNGAVFAREGLGCLLTFDHLVDTSPGSGLVSRPLAPRLWTYSHLAWRKDVALSPLAQRFLGYVRTEFEG